MAFLTLQNLLEEDFGDSTQQQNWIWKLIPWGACTYLSLGGRRKLSPAGPRSAKSALCLQQFPREAVEGSKVSEGEGFLCVPTCAWTSLCCFPSPTCLVWEWEAPLPREWLAFGRTPAPLEKQAENSGKICAASWGEGRKGDWEAWRYSQAACQPGAQ